MLGTGAVLGTVELLITVLCTSGVGGTGFSAALWVLSGRLLCRGTPVCRDELGVPGGGAAADSTVGGPCDAVWGKGVFPVSWRVVEGVWERSSDLMAVNEGSLKASFDWSAETSISNSVLKAASSCPDAD